MLKNLRSKVSGFLKSDAVKGCAIVVAEVAVIIVVTSIVAVGAKELTNLVEGVIHQSDEPQLEN